VFKLSVEEVHSGKVRISQIDLILIGFVLQGSARNHREDSLNLGCHGFGFCTLRRLAHIRREDVHHGDVVFRRVACYTRKRINTAKFYFRLIAAKMFDSVVEPLRNLAFLRESKIAPGEVHAH